MAVTAGIFIQVILVIRLCIVEIFQRLYLNSQGSAVLFRQFGNCLPDNRKVFRMGVVDTGAVLDAPVFPPAGSGWWDQWF